MLNLLTMLMRLKHSKITNMWHKKTIKEGWKEETREDDKARQTSEQAKMQVSTTKTERRIRNHTHL